MTYVIMGTLGLFIIVTIGYFIKKAFLAGRECRGPKENE
jgi:hypothetical protein